MSSSRRRILVALLATVLAALALPVVPASGADDDPQLTVAITSLSPTQLAPGSDVTLTGTVTNDDGHAWGKVQAYLVIPASPFTTRAQINEATTNSKAYTGVRVVDVGAFDELGDMAAGEERGFSVKVPYEKLGITGSEGVYPVGVQILATDTDGSRSPTAIARATTFLPMVTGQQEPVDTSVLWPFVMPDHLDANGTYAAPAKLLTSVSPGGQLRNLLDLASGTPGVAATALVDPALLVGVDDLANGRRTPDSLVLTPGQKAAAQQFLDDLLTFARSSSPWVLDFDRPDDLALSENPDLAGPLNSAVDTATSAALATYQLSGRRVSWPTRGGVTRGLLADLRGSGNSPVIVTPSAVPDWARRLGSLVKYNTADGPMPLLVDDLQMRNSDGVGGVVTLRQQILSSAAVSVLERTIDPDSKADSVTVVDPTWDPGPRWATGKLGEAFSAPFTQGTSLDSVLARPLSTYSGDVPRQAAAKAVARAQLQAASDIVANGKTLSSVVPQDDDSTSAFARSVANVLSLRWRQDRPTGLAIATDRARRIGGQLDKISIEAPPSVTLSSSKGGFPLTIRNDTDTAIKIGVALDSSNPALTIPDVDAVDVGAGERRTITVQVDLGSQRTAFLTAHLRTGGGKDVGMPDTFQVRSSSIGAVLWVAMGLAVLFVLVTLVRRFHRRRTGSSTEPLADDD